MLGAAMGILGEGAKVIKQGFSNTALQRNVPVATGHITTGRAVLNNITAIDADIINKEAHVVNKIPPEKPAMWIKANVDDVASYASGTLAEAANLAERAHIEPGMRYVYMFLSGLSYLEAFGVSGAIPAINSLYHNITTKIHGREEALMSSLIFTSYMADKLTHQGYAKERLFKRLLDTLRIKLNRGQNLDDAIRNAFYVPKEKIKEIDDYVNIMQSYIKEQRSLFDIEQLVEVRSDEQIETIKEALKIIGIDAKVIDMMDNAGNGKYSWIREIINNPNLHTMRDKLKAILAAAFTANDVLNNPTRYAKTFGRLEFASNVISIDGITYRFSDDFVDKVLESRLEFADGKSRELAARIVANYANVLYIGDMANRSADDIKELLSTSKGRAYIEKLINNSEKMELSEELLATLDNPDNVRKAWELIKVFGTEQEKRQFAEAIIRNALVAKTQGKDIAGVIIANENKDLYNQLKSRVQSNQYDAAFLVEEKVFTAMEESAYLLDDSARKGLREALLMIDSSKEWAEWVNGLSDIELIYFAPSAINQWLTAVNGGDFAINEKQLKEVLLRGGNIMYDLINNKLSKRLGKERGREGFGQIMGRILWINGLKPAIPVALGGVGGMYLAFTMGAKSPATGAIIGTAVAGVAIGAAAIITMHMIFRLADYLIRMGAAHARLKSRNIEFKNGKIHVADNTIQQKANIIREELIEKYKKMSLSEVDTNSILEHVTNQLEHLPAAFEEGVRAALRNTDNIPDQVRDELIRQVHSMVPQYSLMIGAKTENLKKAIQQLDKLQLQLDKIDVNNENAMAQFHNIVSKMELHREQFARNMADILTQQTANYLLLMSTVLQLKQNKTLNDEQYNQLVKQLAEAYKTEIDSILADLPIREAEKQAIKKRIENLNLEQMAQARMTGVSASRVNDTIKEVINKAIAEVFSLRDTAIYMAKQSDVHAKKALMEGLQYAHATSPKTTIIHTHIDTNTGQEQHMTLPIIERQVVKDKKTKTIWNRITFSLQEFAKELVQAHKQGYLQIRSVKDKNNKRKNTKANYGQTFLRDVASTIVWHNGYRNVYHAIVKDVNRFFDGLVNTYKNNPDIMKAVDGVKHLFNKTYTEDLAWKELRNSIKNIGIIKPIDRNQTQYLITFKSQDPDRRPASIMLAQAKMQLLVNNQSVTKPQSFLYDANEGVIYLVELDKQGKLKRAEDGTIVKHKLENGGIAGLQFAANAETSLIQLYRSLNEAIATMKDHPDMFAELKKSFTAFLKQHGFNIKHLDDGFVTLLVADMLNPDASAAKRLIRNMMKTYLREQFPERAHTINSKFVSELLEKFMVDNVVNLYNTEIVDVAYDTSGLAEEFNDLMQELEQARNTTLNVIDSFKAHEAVINTWLADIKQQNGGKFKYAKNWPVTVDELKAKAEQIYAQLMGPDSDLRRAIDIIKKGNIQNPEIFAEYKNLINNLLNANSPTGKALQDLTNLRKQFNTLKQYVSNLASPPAPEILKELERLEKLLEELENNDIALLTMEKARTSVLRGNGVAKIDTSESIIAKMHARQQAAAKVAEQTRLHKK